MNFFFISLYWYKPHEATHDILTNSVLYTLSLWFRSKRPLSWGTPSQSVFPVVTSTHTSIWFFLSFIYKLVTTSNFNKLLLYVPTCVFRLGGRSTYKSRSRQLRHAASLPTWDVLHAGPLHPYWVRQFPMCPLSWWIYGGWGSLWWYKRGTVLCSFVYSATVTAVWE